MLEEGKNAPDFKLKNQNGETVKLSDQRGKKIALYFYPKDDTPGCTKQACSLRDGFSGFAKSGNYGLRRFDGQRSKASKIYRQIRSAV